MKIEIEQKSPIEKKLSIEVEPERYDKIVEKLIREISREIQIPGFRRGKAPKKIIINRVGIDALKHDLLEELIPEVTKEVLKEHKLSPLDTPTCTNYKDVILELGKPINFELTFQVKPEFEMEGYKGLELVKIKRDISIDEIVEKHVEKLRHRYGTMTPIEEERELREGDVAQVDFKSFYEDGTEVPGGEAENFYMAMEEDNFIPDFMENVLGHKSGDKWEFKANFPEDYPNEAMSGKEIKFKVKLKAIMYKELPEKDDEFAMMLGEYETYEELEKDMRKEVEEIIENQKRGELEEQVAHQLAKLIKGVMIPPAMVNFHIQRFMSKLDEQLKQIGKNMGKHLEEIKSTRQEFMKGFYPQARKNAMAELAIDKIIRKEGIEVTDAELDEEIAEMAEKMDQDFETLKSYLEKNNQLEEFRSTTLIKKVFDFIIENAIITEKTREEVMAERSARDALKVSVESETGEETSEEEAPSEGDATAEESEPESEESNSPETEEEEIKAEPDENDE